jgi:hypothetical protein
MDIINDKPPPLKEEKNGTDIKTLVISNVAETYYKTYKKQPEDFETRIRYDFLEAERGLFYTDDNKAVVTSLPVDSVFLEDLKQILGHKYLINLYPINPTYRLCFDIISDKQLLSQITEIIRANPGISLIPYYATEEFFDLVALLRHKDLKFTTPETVSSKNRFIRDHYNCKVGFRKLWEKATDQNSFVNVPQGFIVDDLQEGIDAGWWFKEQKKNFVIKYNRGTSGFGIVFYDLAKLPKDERNFKKYLRSNHQDKIWFEENFVVEEMIDVDKEYYGGSPSVEFKVNGDVRHTYNCLQRLDADNYFEGVLISKIAEDESDVDFERVEKNCEEFGEALLDLGYRGIFDVDLVIDKKHNIYAVESNLRRTGGTHIYETAQYLLGKNFRQKVIVASKDNLVVSQKIKNYPDFKKYTSQLYFTKEKNHGIIPTITSFLPTGHIGYIVIGKDMNEVGIIEEELKKAIS